MVLSAFKSWTVELVEESGCEVIDGGSRVQRVLTRSDGKVEKDTVTPIEERLKSRTWTKDMTSSTSPRLSSTRTTTRFTEERNTVIF